MWAGPGVGRGVGEKGRDSVCHLEVELSSLRLIELGGQIRR